MTEERILISQKYLAKMAPCLISYPTKDTIAKVFIAPTGETFALKYNLSHTDHYIAPYSTLENLSKDNSQELLNMFSGKISHIYDVNELENFQQELMDDLDNMRGHYGKPNVPHPSEIQHIQDRLQEISKNI